MQVKWKILCSFGMLFWSAMCAIEYVFGTISQKGEFSKLTEVEMETHYNDDLVEEPTYFNWKRIVFWCLFSFSSSLCVCIITKLIKINIKRKLREAYERHSVLANGNETKDQAVGLDGKISLTNTQSKEVRSTFTTCPTLLDVVRDFPVSTDGKENNVKCPDVKRTTKVSESISDHGGNKDFASLNKKLENLIKEKKDLSSKLAHSEKENKQARQHLEEIMNDRTLLIKKLECATREIKLNTNSKQITLEKLEEAINCSNQMKAKIIALTSENSQLGDKIKTLEIQYRTLQEHAQILQKQDRSVKKLKELSDCITSELENESDRELDVSESEKEIEKVQNKLHDLERSLEKMRLSVKPCDDSSDAVVIDGGELKLQIEENFLVNNADAKIQESNEDFSDYVTPSIREDGKNVSCDERSQFENVDIIFDTYSSDINESSNRSLSTTDTSYSDTTITSECDDDESEIEIQVRKGIDDELSKDISTISSSQIEVISKSTQVSKTVGLIITHESENLDDDQKAQISSLNSYSTEEDCEQTNSLDTISGESTITSDYEFESDMQLRTGMVSQSPAFQKFLLKVLDINTDTPYEISAT